MIFAQPFPSVRRCYTESQSRGRLAAWGVTLLLLSLAVAAACGDTVVTTVDVQQVRVNPSQAPLSVGATIQLQAELLDNDGKAVTGVPVSWSTDDESVVAVNGIGEVTGRNAGEAVVRATADGVTGTATIRVASPAYISLSPNSIRFTTGVGSTDPRPTEVTVTNTGGEALESLESEVVYPDGEPDGWLTAVLDSRVADTELTVRASTGTLGEGTYSATVLIKDPAAVNSPATIAVELDLREDLPSAPSAPSNLSAEGVSNSAIRLSWSDVATEERYELQRSTDGTSFTTVEALDADVSTYTDSGLESDTRYWYRLRACNDGGCSDYAGPVSATTDETVPDAPATPSNFSAEADSDSAIRLSWSDLATEERYELQRSTDGTSFTTVETLDADVTTHTDSGLESDTRYWYRVRACNDGGCSDYAGPVSATTEETVPDAPATPSNFSAEADSDSAIRLSWGDVATEDRYELQRSTDGTSFSALETLNADVTTHTDSGLESETRYWYRVRACNDGGCSDYAGPVSARTLDPAPLAAPSDLEASRVTEDYVDLSWQSNNDGETEFLILRGRDHPVHNRFEEIGSIRTDAERPTYRDRNVREEWTYHYRIEACDGSGQCESSNTITVTIPDD